jgi:glycosyl transferase family 25
MLGLCLNLDHASDRWEYTRKNFAKVNIHLQRVSAVVGRNLPFPIPEHDSDAYRRWHGKLTIPGEVGCYLSHIKAMDLFLDSQESHALICEDDVKPVDALQDILSSAFAHQEHWDILRLSGFRDAKPQSIVALTDGYALSINLRFLAGTGAYVINRHAATVLREKLLPMFLPYDHALDREWEWGLRSLSVNPLPIDQGEHEFRTQIQTRNSKVAWYHRYWTVLPFRLKTHCLRYAARKTALLAHRLRIGQEQRSNPVNYRLELGAACLTMNKA